MECKLALLAAYIEEECGCKDPYQMSKLEFYDPATWSTVLSGVPHCYTDADWTCVNTATYDFLADPSEQVSEISMHCTFGEF